MRGRRRRMDSLRLRREKKQHKCTGDNCYKVFPFQSQRSECPICGSPLSVLPKGKSFEIDRRHIC